VWQQQVGAGVSVRWPGGLAARGDEGVAGEVRRSPGGLGYVSLSYALRHKVPFALVQNRAGAFVKADANSVAAAASACTRALPEDLRASLIDAPGKNSYPITGAVWAVVSDRLPEARRRAVAHFLRWAAHDGQRSVEGLDLGRLPPAVVERLDRQLERLQPGK
jgi:phosphate transport system substrate-binding protein